MLGERDARAARVSAKDKDLRYDAEAQRPSKKGGFLFRGQAGRGSYFGKIFDTGAALGQFPATCMDLPLLWTRCKCHWIIWARR
jgi:hypothetical protein